ncbi:MAG: hypothetical protein M0R17_03115 [Candidatus Omnitrophica bacterium]|jgi:hypothetical protein|nr:hypothetical protein [Candidatus Omnitrophota bacterium]
MLKSWQDLEDYVENLLKGDDSVKPKGSGNAKKEEDIISNNIIAQCKYTEHKNHGLLEKDILRLLDACKLQDKFPLFVTANQSETILSVIINKNTSEYVEDFIKYITVKKGMARLENDISRLSNINQITYSTKLSNKLLNLFNNIKNKITNKYESIGKSLKVKYDDLTMCDLFEK